MQKIVAKLKAQVGVIRENIAEIWTGFLIVVGLPLVAYVYCDWKLSLSVFVLVNIFLGIVALRTPRSVK